MFLLLLLPVFALAQVSPPAHQKLFPTLWTQASVEWRASCLNTYVGARLALPRSLKDRNRSAAVEQTGKLRGLPPAVVLDIDETVLDNSPGQARQVLANSEFDAKMWDEWVLSAQADAIPGAVDFCRFAESRGVRVFFVSNRDARHEEATRANLKRLGFPLDPARDTVLLRGERPDWGSDKSTRRAYIGETHRIVMLVGDDLGDFLGGARTSHPERMAKAEPYTPLWGDRWIILPNPSYGSWEEALVLPDKPSTAQQQLDRRKTFLQPKR